jgi:hypothetical protein
LTYPDSYREFFFSLKRFSAASPIRGIIGIYNTFNEFEIMAVEPDIYGDLLGMASETPNVFTYRGNMSDEKKIIWAIK